MEGGGEHREKGEQGQGRRRLVLCEISAQRELPVLVLDRLLSVFHSSSIKHQHASSRFMVYVKDYRLLQPWRHTTQCIFHIKPAAPVTRDGEHRTGHGEVRGSSSVAVSRAGI